MEDSQIYRILDANLNRMREGIRVIEEYHRFANGTVDIATRLKEMRHKVRELDDGLDLGKLLQGRDSENDPFSSGVIAKESQRSSIKELLLANTRRAQEAARVLEEYLKLIDGKSSLSYIAKEIRFSLYTVEKLQVIDGKE